MASIEQVSAHVDTKVNDLVEKMDSRVAKCEERQDGADKKMDAMQNQMDRFEHKIDHGCSQGGFVPQNIEVKNMCELKYRRSNGMTRPEAEKLVEDFKEELPESLRGKIGEIRMRGFRAYKFRLDVAPPHAEEVSSIFKDALKEPSLRFNMRELYTTVERTPEDQKMVAAGGKARVFLASRC